MYNLNRQQLKTRNGYTHNNVMQKKEINRPATGEDAAATQYQPTVNRAVLRFIQSCPLSLPNTSKCPFGGICHSCPKQIRAKFKIRRPGDKYEQEADRTAEEVLRIPDPVPTEVPLLKETQGNSGIQRKCPECEEEYQRQPVDKNEEEEPVQLKETTDHLGNSDNGLEADLKFSTDGGHPLSNSVRSFFEPRFGYDFSRVRIHTDLRAAKSANSINARSYTIGNNIVFGKGEYSPALKQVKNY